MAKDVSFFPTWKPLPLNHSPAADWLHGGLREVEEQVCQVNLQKRGLCSSDSPNGRDGGLAKGLPLLSKEP